MKTGAVILLVAIAALIGYFLGLSGSFVAKAPAPVLTSHVEAPANPPDPIFAHTDHQVRTVDGSDAPQFLARQDPRTAVDEEVEAMRQGDVSAVADHILFTPEATALMESVVVSAPPPLRINIPSTTSATSRASHGCCSMQPLVWPSRKTEFI